MKLLILIFLFISGCGEIKSVKRATEIVTAKSDKAATPITQTTTSPMEVSGPYTPGSYFKILKEVESKNDTRLYEFKYLKDGNFEIKQTSFPEGDLAIGYYHLSTGTYKEDDKGVITHVLLTDSCNDLTGFSASVSGDANEIIRVVSKGQTVDLYSVITWTIPKSITEKIGSVSEDVGCKKF